MKHQITPLYSEILPNLYMGGTDDLATINQPQTLKEFRGDNEFDCIVTLYAWAAPANWGVEERRFGFPDAEIIDEYLPTIVELARWAYTKWSYNKRVNVRCQAGLNRSGLVTALVLIMSGMTPEFAIEMIRKNRSSDALCNPDYEYWLLNEAKNYIMNQALEERV